MSSVSNVTLQALKGQCHEIFDTFLSKNSTWTPYEELGKNGFAKFFVFTKYLQKTCVHVAVDYADTVWTHAEIVVDYANTMSV